jgi:hypothetical protein
MDFTRYWAGRIVNSGPRQSVMIARKPLTEIAVYSVAMPVTVGLCLWVLLGPFRVDRYLGAPIPGPAKATFGAANTATVPAAEPDSATAIAVPVPAAEADSGPAIAVPVAAAEADSGPATVVPVAAAEADSGPATVVPVAAAEVDSGPATVVPVPAAEADPETTTVVLFPGDDGRLLAQMQGALIGKGYSVGPVGADANDDTLAALEAFQSNNALPVQPKCDQQCRAALGLPDQQ